MGFFSRRSNQDEPESSDDTPSTESEDTTPPPPSDPPPDTNNIASRTFDTALGAGSSLEGSLTSSGNVRLDGDFKGTLDIKENVLVGVTAEIEADIAAENVSVAGTVRGDVSGKKVHLLATARVWGNITAESLITEDGAFIQGHIKMEKETTAPTTPEVTEANLAEPDDDEENEEGGMFPL